MEPSYNNFVGRERELAESRAALDDTNDGRGRLFLLSGEPGIGKTRLAEEIAREAAARGMRAVWGRCWEGGGAPAYWPWIQVIRSLLGSDKLRERRLLLESELMPSTVETVAQIVPELGAPASDALKHPMTPGLNPEEARFRLFDSVTTLLKHFVRSKPFAIIIDDLHDADDASLMMLRFLARELTGTPIIIICTYRDSEARRSAALAKHIRNLGRDARSIPLAGLSHAEVAELIARSWGEAPEDDLVTKLHAATGGNPLFIDGVVRMLASDRDCATNSSSGNSFKIPATVHEAIRRRLSMLSKEARAILDIGAAIGNEFDGEVCIKVAKVSLDEFTTQLHQTTGEGIVVALLNGRYRFAHALIRGVIYDSLEENTRAELHAQIGTAIEEVYAKDLDPHLAELAHHFRSANEKEKAINYSLSAALANDALHAYTVSAPHLHAALSLTEGHRDERRAQILFHYGRVIFFHLDREDGFARLEESLELFREIGNGQMVAHLNFQLGIAITAQPGFAPGMTISRALDYFQKAQEWRGEWRDPETPGFLHYAIANTLHFADRNDEAIAAAEISTRLFKRAWFDLQNKPRSVRARSAGPRWLMSAAMLATLIQVKGRVRESKVTLEEVLAHLPDAIRARDPEILKTTIQWACSVPRSLRNPLDAIRLHFRAMERKDYSPNQRNAFINDLIRSELMASNLKNANLLAIEHSLATARLGALAFWNGDWEGASELHRTSAEWARGCGYRWAERNSLAALAEIFRVSRDYERATEYVRLGQPLFDPSDLLFQMDFRPTAALLAIDAGRVDEAVEHLEVLRSIRSSAENWEGHVATCEHVEGALAAIQRRKFAAHFETSTAVAKKYSLQWAEADALRDWGIALQRIGERQEANHKFDASIEVYQRCGAGQRFVDRVEAARHAGQSSLTMPDATGSLKSGSFRREGEFWTIAYQGATFRLKDVKGLAYVAFLIAHPNEQFHARDLAAVVDGPAVGKSLDASVGDTGLSVVGDLDGAAPGLDPRARADYKHRMNDLRDELDEAERFNDIGRAARARQELDFLNAELASAAGLGGRGRRSGSHAERARLMVGKNIRAAIEKIGRESPALGRFLSTAIRTGYHCSYQPDPDRPVCWQL